jgi:type IV secretory pathway TraG/TraD family ATPase VirD4
MKKEIFTILLGAIGLAFYLTLGLIVAPYIENGGLLLMLIKPYKPFLQYEWVGKTSINCMICFAVVYAITVFTIWLRGRAVRAGEEYGSMKWLTAKELGKKYSGSGMGNRYRNNSQYDGKREKRGSGGSGRIVTKNICLNEDTQALGRNLNMIVEGGPGTSKTRGVVIPNILQTAISGKNSLMVVDPKGYVQRNL